MSKLYLGKLCFYFCSKTIYFLKVLQRILLYHHCTSDVIHCNSQYGQNKFKKWQYFQIYNRLYIYLKCRFIYVKFSWNYKLNPVIFETLFSNGILWWYLVQFPLSLIFLATFVAFADILKIENPHKLSSWIYLQLHIQTMYFILSYGVICGIRNIMSLIFRNKKRTIPIK